MKNLKKCIQWLMLLVCIASIISLTSCKDDDSVSGLPLVGTIWTEYSEEVDCADEENSQDIEFCEDCFVIIFNDDGTFSQPGEENNEASYTYTVNGDELTLLVEIEEFAISTTVNFIIIEDELILSDFNDGDYTPEMSCVVITTLKGK